MESGCSLIGGETAQMPDMYKPGEYDLAGFCVGVVEKKKIIDGSRIRPGDMIIGLESSGIHSNGYSLVRKVFSSGEQKRLSKELLTPTRIYVKLVLDLLRTTNDERRTTVHGISHITGGACYDKIRRILPDNVDARIEKNSWVVPKIFQLIQNKGGVEDREMYHTFNMGVGMVLMVEPGSAEGIIKKLAEHKLRSWVIGKITSGKREVSIA
jgi:phosphoribosylformylglycinamidine cyclo-ligase